MKKRSLDETAVIKIRNKDYTVKEASSGITKAVIEEVSNYRLDPNCSADLWMQDPHLKLTEQEKVAFIYLINFC